MKEVFELGIIQALNDLAYLKDKKANENKQLEKIKKHG